MVSSASKCKRGIDLKIIRSRDWDTKYVSYIIMLCIIVLCFIVSYITVSHNWIIIKSLNDPWLVFKVQYFFGVRYEKEKHTSNSLNSASKTSLILNQGGIVIHNKFWYIFFLLGTALGDEIFYATFLPFWLWNIDVLVGRKFILVWTTCMYVGQALKEIIQWPRPGYPVQKLQRKWALEYGMPSTHAMVGISIPFSIIIFTMDRYHYPILLGMLIAFSCCVMICVSRIYLGMHSFLDVIAGIILASLLMAILVPIIDLLDKILVTNWFSPLIIFPTSMILIIFHPKAEIWTPTRGDSTIVVGVCTGGLTGCWANYQLGYLMNNGINPPFPIVWPSFESIFYVILRTIIGFSGIFATKILFKYVFSKFSFNFKNTEISQVDEDTILVELCYKYFTYMMIGFNTTFIFPILFKKLGVLRPTFYSDV